MKSDYDYYVIGCDSSNLTPLPQQQFQQIYDRPVSGISLLKGVISSYKTFQQTYAASQAGDLVRSLVRLGKTAAGDTGSQDEGGAASSVREPRSPQEPVLTGQAARPLPNADAPDTAFWRT